MLLRSNTQFQLYPCMTKLLLFSMFYLFINSSSKTDFKVNALGINKRNESQKNVTRFPVMLNLERQTSIGNDLYPFLSQPRSEIHLNNVQLMPKSSLSTSTFAHFENYPSNKHENQKTKSNFNTGLENSGAVVFPDSAMLSTSSRSNISSKKNNKPKKFIPDISEIEKCRKNSIGGSLCNNTENYPESHIRNILVEKNVTKDFFGNDSLESDDLNMRFNDDTHNYKSLCNSVEQMEFPKLGETKTNGWRYIMQNFDDDNLYTQGIRIEVCSKEYEQCQFFENIPNGYVVHCVQKYIYRKLVSIKENEEVYYDSFKIPSCCVCMYKEPVNSRSTFG